MFLDEVFSQVLRYSLHEGDQNQRETRTKFVV
jgi:hypothetical protein